MKNKECLYLVSQDEWKNSAGGPAHADVIRMSLMIQYGGIYIDADTVLLRDMSMLVGHQFGYQWGEERNKYNTAALGCKKGCPVLKCAYGYHRVKEKMSAWDFHPWQLREQLDKSHCEVRFISRKISKFFDLRIVSL